MPRRLVNRTGGGTWSVSQTPAPDSEPVTYQPPSFPLNEIAINKIGDLSSVRDTLAYQNQIKDSLRNLGHGVYDLQDRLLTQRGRLDKTRSQRHERGGDKQPDEEHLEKHVAELEADVEELTRRSEAATRHAIDQRVALEDDTAALGDLYTTSMTNRRAAPGTQEEQGNGDEMPPAPPSTLDTLRDSRNRKKAEYDAIPNSERYALDNDYVSFKKLWHDGLTGEDGPPLPDASKWFRADGTPAMSGAEVLGAVGANPDDSDEDLAVAREVLSLNCPLTLRPLEEPYSNRKCKHTFEKSAILDYLHNGRGQAMQCPQTGCSEVRTPAAIQGDRELTQTI